MEVRPHRSNPHPWGIFRKFLPNSGDTPLSKRPENRFLQNGCSYPLPGLQKYFVFLSGKLFGIPMVKLPTAILGRLLLVFLFLGYYGSTTLFYHVHYDSGTAIIHSHPSLTGDTASNTHQHSRAAYQTIQQLSHILLIFLILDILLQVFRHTYARPAAPLCQYITGICLKLNPLRAPPFRSISC